MKAIAADLKGRTNNGARYICTIVSETEPTSLTVTGADVENMTAGDIIAAGSVLITPAKTYIAFSDGVFTERA